MNRTKQTFEGWAEAGGCLAWVGRGFISPDYEIAVARHMGGRDYLVATGIDDEGRIVWEKSGEAAETPTLIRLPPDALEAILKAASGAQPPSTSLQRHLDDAVAVRDRLLTLIETERCDV